MGWRVVPSVKALSHFPAAYKQQPRSVIVERRGSWFQSETSEVPVIFIGEHVRISGTLEDVLDLITVFVEPPCKTPSSSPSIFQVVVKGSHDGFHGLLALGEAFEPLS